jgi:hypothetical protein
MRVSLFTSLGALVATTGLASAQPPAPAPLPPGTATDAATSPALPAQPNTPPATGTAPPILATPTPAATVPAPAGPAAGPAVQQSAVAAFQGVPPGWTPGAPISDLAQWYNIPVHGPQAWFGAEYLMWWVRPMPVPAPLVNTTIVPVDLATSISTGSIIDPNAVTIVGRERINFGTFSGVRATAGRWLDACQEVGVEANFFIFPEQTRSFVVVGGTGPNATPALTVPFNSVGGAFLGETSTTIAGPFAGAAINGAVGVRLTSDLWGGDADGLLNLAKGEFWRMDAIGGFKFLALDESMEFATALRTAPFGATLDTFRTRNRFYGGEIGVRGSTHMEKLSFDGTVKVGLGDTQRELDIRGASIIPDNLGGGTAAGGLFALASNIGRTNSGKFSVVPQLNATLAYNWNCHFRTSIGYNFLYWTDVNRPGDQIDRNINPNLAPVFGGGPGGTGPAQPQRLNHDNDFIAHGLSFGLDLTW